MSYGRLNSPAAFRIAIGTALCAVVIWLTVLTATGRPSGRPNDPQNEILNRIQSCIEASTDSSRQTRVGSQAMTLAQVGCINYIRGEFSLLDYNIRRSEFIQQQFRGEILLWMVVTITFAGVGLAALQLFAAYQLARLGNGSGSSLATEGQLSIEHGKISVRSSVTGLLVLALSLAFFIVYVKWIYPVIELRPDSSTNTQSAANLILPGVGQLLPANQIQNHATTEPQVPQSGQAGPPGMLSSPAQLKQDLNGAAWPRK
jgi:hypothetical protein